MTIYEAHAGSKVADHAVEAEARAAVEAHGSGYVVTFVRGYDGRDRSCAMNVFKNGAWDGVYIHG
jgi:hypothetical protein